MNEKSAAFERRIVFVKAYDHTAEKPGGGIAGVEIFFVLIGPLGAMTWSILTDWMLPTTRSRLKSMQTSYRSSSMAGAVVAHRPPRDGEDSRPNCEWIGGGPCTGGTGCLAGDIPFAALTKDGEEGVWRELEKFYESWIVEDVPASKEGA